MITHDNFLLTNFSKNYLYDTQYPLSNIVAHDFYTFDFMILENDILYWDNGSNALTVRYKRNFYYSSIIINSVSEIELDSYQVYPNPCSNSVQFKIAKSSSVSNLSVYDVQGHLILSTIINSNQQVDVSNLEFGLYLFQIQTKGNTRYGKFIKQ